jgi:hypothetical protein
MFWRAVCPRHPKADSGVIAVAVEDVLPSLTSEAWALKMAADRVVVGVGFWGHQNSHFAHFANLCF